MMCSLQDGSRFPGVPSLAPMPCVVLSHFESGLHLVTHFWNRTEYCRNDGASLRDWVRSRRGFIWMASFSPLDPCPAVGTSGQSAEKPVHRRLRSSQWPGRNWGQRQPWMGAKKGVLVLNRSSSWQLDCNSMSDVSYKGLTEILLMHRAKSLVKLGVIVTHLKRQLLSSYCCFIGLSSLLDY